MTERKQEKYEHGTMTKKERKKERKKYDWDMMMMKKMNKKIKKERKKKRKKYDRDMMMMKK